MSTGEPRKGWRHGTHTGWARHIEEGTDPCESCRQARREYDARRKSATSLKIAARRHSRAQTMANTALRRAHREEYTRYYDLAKLELAAREAATATYLASEARGE